MNADRVTMRDVTYENRNVDPHPGDGLELWNVTDFLIANATVRGALGGSGIDLYGARRGTVDGFVIEGGHEGIEIAENTSLHTYSEQVEVRNGAPSALSYPAELPGTGHGLIGIGERAAVFGGTAEAGPASDGGFRVYARFPRDHALV